MDYVSLCAIIRQSLLPKLTIPATSPVQAYVFIALVQAANPAQLVHLVKFSKADRVLTSVRLRTSIMEEDA